MLGFLFLASQEVNSFSTTYRYDTAYYNHHLPTTTTRQQRLYPVGASASKQRMLANTPSMKHSLGKPQSTDQQWTGTLHQSEGNGNMDDTARDDDSNNNNKISILDTVLSRLTSFFPFFVLFSAILGLKAPSTLEWVNQGPIITAMLASVMMGTGMTLEKKDFENVLTKYPGSVPAGVLCQFLIMPLSAFLVGRTFLLNVDPIIGPPLFLGLCLVGCSPGGTASNLVSLIAGSDVALSVLLTACSTILASVATPLLVKTLVGGTVSVSGVALCSATARVVLLPVILGMLLNAKAPKLSRIVSRFTPFASVVLVALICGGVVAQNAGALLGSTTTLIPLILSSVLLLHSIGFLAGFVVPRFGLRYSKKTARTISIETGMQNSALAVVLARSIGAPLIASLPGAISATVHSCLGILLAAYWRYSDSREETQ